MNTHSPGTGSSALRRSLRSRLVRGGVGTVLAGVLGLSGALVTAGVAGAAPINGFSTTGSTYYVDVNGTGTDCSQSSPCDSLGQAIYDAYDSDAMYYGTVTIEVGPGTFYENDNTLGGIDGPNPNIVIAGVPGQTFFNSDGDTPAITNDCTNLTVEGITFYDYETALVNICGHVVAENDSFYENGTGIDSYPDDGWVTTIANNSMFFNNEVGFDAEDLKATVDSSTFTENELGFELGSAYATVNNSTFDNNESGIANEDGYVQVSSSTIDRNYDGIYNDSGDGEVTSFGTIIVNNYNANCWGAAVTDNGYNIDNYGDCDFSSGQNSDYHDPKLGTLQDNGGYTWTQAILPGSSAYEKIPAADCPSVDQRGESRPAMWNSTNCDIGAYEYNSPVAIQFVSNPLCGPASYNANLTSAVIQAVDDYGLPAVSTHAMVLTLSSTDNNANFALSSLGQYTNQVVIPTGSTTGAFAVGSVTPGPVPVTVSGTDGINNLGTATQTEHVYTGPAYYLYKTAGDNQTTTVGTAFANGLSVNTTDYEENPVDNETITYQVTSGGATFNGSSSTTVSTDVNGDATSPTLTAGTVPGPVTVTATTSTNVVVTFNLTQVVGPPATITINSGNNQSVNSDQAFSTPLSVTVADRFGNVISGAQVDFEVTSGSSSFAGSAITTGVTDNTGTTSVSSLTAGDLGGTQNITATVDGTTVSATFTGISVTAKTTTATASSFALGSSVLSPAMKKQLDTLAATIKKYGNTSVTISGYASNEGSQALNVSLSLARAAAAKTYLAADLKTLHVGGVTITAVGKGATNFVSSNHSAAVNRRVVVAIV